MEIISGIFRPTRSASQPEATAPIKRIHKVRVSTKATSLSGTPNSCEIGTMINRKTVKSKASRVQPSHAAHQAYHCSLVGSFHHGMSFTLSTAAIAQTSSSTCCFTGSTPGSESGNNEVRNHLDIFGLGAEQQGNDEIYQPEQRAYRHRDCEAKVPRRVGREVGQDRWH